MGYRLRRIYQNGDASLPSPARDLLHRIDDTQRIGEMDQRYQPGTVIQQSRELIEIEPACLGERYSAEHGTGLFAHQLPWHDVRVVFHSGDKHLVTGAKEAPAIALSDKIDRISGAPGENHFVRRRSIDELGDLDSHCVEGGAGLAAQMMHTTVNVGVFPAVK